MTRAEFEYRGVVLGGDRGELLGGLGALAGGESAPGVVEGVLVAGGGGGVVFVFPGQGAQWEGMAVELLECSGVFAERLGECGDALEPFVGWRVEDVLRGGLARRGWIGWMWCSLCCSRVMVSLARLWGACGVEPAVVVGHSQGEIAAACVAGGLSLEDAARVVALRGRALAGLAGVVGWCRLLLGLIGSGGCRSGSVVSVGSRR